MTIWSRTRGLACVLAAAALGAAACDGGADGGTGSVTQPPPPDPMRVGPEGGAVHSADGVVTLQIPAGALSQPVTFSVAPTTSHPGGAAGTVYHIGPSGTRFATPATLRLRLPASLPAGVSGEELRLATVEAGSWSPVASTLDAAAGVITGPIPHLSTWGIVSRFSLDARSCPELVLPTASGVPLDFVEVRGVPASFDSLIAGEFELLGGGPAIPAPAVRGDNGVVHLSVPIHPGGSVNGGAAALRMVDASGRACQSVPFTVQPLPPAAGTLDRMIRSIADLIASHAASLGVGMDELRAMNASAVPDVLRPVHDAWVALESPDNPNNLRALASGSAPVAREHPADMDLLDRLLARTALPTELEQAAAAMTALDNAVSGNRRSGVDAAAAAARSSNGAPELVTTAAELHRHMERARRLLAVGEGNRERVLSDVSRVAAHAAMLPSPHVKAVAITVSIGLLIFNDVTLTKAAALPSDFTSISFHPSPDRFTADDPRTGSIDSVMVTARSRGHNRQENMLNAALQVAMIFVPMGAPQAAVGAPSVGYWANEFGHRALAEAMEMAVKALPPGAAHQIPPRSFGPIDIAGSGGDGRTFSQARYTGALEGTGHMQFRLAPSWLGPLQGLVEVRSADGMFGGAQIMASRAVVIDETSIAITPANATVEGGETVEFEVQVQNSAGDDVAISVTGGSVLLHTRQGAGLHAIRYAAPASGFKLASLHVTLPQATGLYANPQRQLPHAVATVRERGDSTSTLAVSPRATCIAPGATLQLQATLDGTEAAVTWSADAGSITPAGLFSAPAAATNVRITATAADGLTATSLIRVGSCTCWWTMEATGGFATSYTSPSGSFTEVLGQRGIVLVAGMFDDVDFGTVNIGFYDQIPVGATGSMPVIVTTVHAPGAPQTWQSALDEDDLQFAPMRPVLTLTRNDDIMAGSVRGQLYRLPGGSTPPALVHIEFSVPRSVYQCRP